MVIVCHIGNLQSVDIVFWTVRATLIERIVASRCVGFCDIGTIAEFGLTIALKGMRAVKLVK